jgi:hypothetical protein
MGTDGTYPGGEGAGGQTFNLAATTAKMRFRRYNVLTNHTYLPIRTRLISTAILLH